MGRRAVFGLIIVALVGIGACSREAEDTVAEPANEPAPSAVGDTAVPAPEFTPDPPAFDPAAPGDPAFPPAEEPAGGGGLIDDNE